MKKKAICIVVSFFAMAILSPNFVKADTIFCDGNCCYIAISAKVHPNGACYSDGQACQVQQPLPGCSIQ